MNYFKLSRIISLVSFFCVIISFYLLFFEKKSATIDELVLVVLVSIVYLIPILIVRSNPLAQDGIAHGNGIAM